MVKSANEIWADRNVDGTPKDPWKPDIRDWGTALEAIAFNGASANIKGYNTLAALHADVAQPAGTIGLVVDPADPVNSYPRVAFIKLAPAIDSWAKSPDTLTSLTNTLNAVVLQSSITTSDVQYIQQQLAVPNPMEFSDPSQYTITWNTIINPSTRFTTFADASGLQVTGISNLGSSLPVGFKTSEGLVPGYSYYLRFMYTAGTLSSQAGFFFGSDPSLTGDISNAAKLTVLRNNQLLPATGTGLAADGTRTLSPPWGAAAAVPDLNVPYTFNVDVLADGTKRFRIFRDNVQIATDVIESPSSGAGALVAGVMIQNGWVAKVQAFVKATLPGNTIFVDSTVAVSGVGLLGNPVKHMFQVDDAIQALRIKGPVTIQCLSDIVYGYAELNDSISRKWTINGRPGGTTKIEGILPAEAIVWSLTTASDNKVYQTPTKKGDQILSFPNQPFLINSPNQALACDWIMFPDKTMEVIPVVTTPANDLKGVVDGGYTTASATLYIKLPDSTPTGFDPTNLPAGKLIVSRVNTVISVIGSPEIALNNLVLSHASGHCFTGGSGFGRLTNVRAEWSGWNSNAFDWYNGNYICEGCEFQYIGNDGYGRAPRHDIVFQAGARYKTVLINCRGSHTWAGDWMSEHEETTYGHTNEVWVINPRGSDCNKAGIICIATVLVVLGGSIRRCGDSQFCMFTPNTGSANGKTFIQYVNGTIFDPESKGRNGVRVQGAAGIGLAQVEIANTWIGKGVANAYGSTPNEFEIFTQTVSGQTIVPANNRLRLVNVSTERDAASRTFQATFNVSGVPTLMGTFDIPESHLVTP
jgi:hypothetical protein